jgi:hypothetical protein
MELRRKCLHTSLIINQRPLFGAEASKLVTRNHRQLMQYSLPVLIWLDLQMRLRSGGGH